MTAAVPPDIHSGVQDENWSPCNAPFLRQTAGSLARRDAIEHQGFRERQFDPRGLY